MKPVYLAACAIVRNEARYIDEWILFHKLEGIQHFIIYDNDSTDHLQHRLGRYIQGGLVTYVKYPGDGMQLKAYQHCLENYGQFAEWIAFIDLDEFLYGTSTRLQKFLTDKTDKNDGAVAVRWYLYGDNYRKEDNVTRLVTERFLRRESEPNKHSKSIVRPEFVRRVGSNAHAFYLKDGHPARDEHGNILPKEYAVMPDGTANWLRIAHFHVKSYPEYIIKRAKPRASTGKIRPAQQEVEFFNAHNKNDVFDVTAARWVNEIHSQMGNT